MLQITAPTGEKFTQILSVGIGGSALGPQFVAEALAPDNPPLKVSDYLSTKLALLILPQAIFARHCLHSRIVLHLESIDFCLWTSSLPYCSCEHVLLLYIMQIRFIDNTDPAGIDHQIAQLGPELATTLVVVISKVCRQVSALIMHVSFSNVNHLN